uniref:Uncharacterized protein n=1 Tax=Chromera velia CCMP2878 TaxID=1169474 RepID=A0A0G4HUJ4_9ALVE|eukprot:Cvel_8666.t1-p1 / transcript=Cvel_8666.t1 / gene=Cvel_8666 / organism=Chromera_velia_CCMP2878 / gene_product=hypothetical protein / transcript_product=hypothetical protein / location=Cvel_scaffold483:56237-58052(-) / protein_length=132 / sequence_SO=supercontig / SO=protein_coding / is_pseudo=false
MKTLLTEVNNLHSELNKQEERNQTLQTEVAKLKHCLSSDSAESSVHDTSKDILEVTVRLPEFETRSAAKQKGDGQYLESLPILFQGLGGVAGGEWRLFPSGGQRDWFFLFRYQHGVGWDMGERKAHRGVGFN